MGIIIQAVNPKAPPPRGVMITLECDQPTAFFCRGQAVFNSDDGYIGCHTAAMSAGWMERNSPEGRLWICPECSGK